MGGAGIGIAVLLGILAFFAFIAAAASIIILPLMFMSKKAQAAFSISPSTIDLIEKNKPKYPDSVARDHVSALFVDGSRPTYSQSSSLVAVGSPGAVAAAHAMHGASQAATGTGQLLGAAIAAFNWSVKIEAYGKSMVLAECLSETEARYLLHRIEVALAK
jgi:hypothetical protein